MSEPSPTKKRKPTDESEESNSQPDVAPRTVIDEEGDLVLRVCEGSDLVREFLVCSAAMRRASPVWKGMLYRDPWQAQVAERDDWAVALQGGDSRAMETLLNILHANLAAVPATFDVRAIYQLVLLMVKYDCLHVARPWLPSWLLTIRSLQLRDSDVICMGIYVVLALGAERHFHALVAYVAGNSRVDPEVGLLFRGTKFPSDVERMGPFDIESLVRDARRKCIQDVFDGVTTLVSEILTWPSAPTRRPAGEGAGDTAPENRARPNYLFLGSFWHAMIAVRGSLLPASPQNITEEPAKFAESLIQVSQMVVSDSAAMPKRRVVEEFAASVTKIHPSTEVHALCGGHRDYFARQREKTGVRECDDAAGATQPPHSSPQVAGVRVNGG